MYRPVQNLTRHVFCLSMTLGLVQKLFDNVLSISLFSSHVCSWHVWLAMTSKLCFLSYLRTCFPRCRIGPLFGVLALNATNLFGGGMV